MSTNLENLQDKHTAPYSLARDKIEYKLRLLCQRLSNKGDLSKVELSVIVRILDEQYHTFTPLQLNKLKDVIAITNHIKHRNMFRAIRSCETRLPKYFPEFVVEQTKGQPEQFYKFTGSKEEIANLVEQLADTEDKQRLYDLYCIQPVLDKNSDLSDASLAWALRDLHRHYLSMLIIDCLDVLDANV